MQITVIAMMYGAGAVTSFIASTIKATSEVTPTKHSGPHLKAVVSNHPSPCRIGNSSPLITP